ncbi:MAG: hypothetical protein JRD93_10195 [Deltaproteobacteria bacterium]|nr:hypothetical protein [Deltaproteobacteria bacterium]MBW2662338.1 hypothetical protein [Deltaproteobacteria bacterium]
MRLLILLAVIYFGYRALKSWVLPGQPLQRPVSGKAANKIDDEMIKDPYCNVYFPKRNGVHLKVDGKDLYFCSTECRDKFIASHSEKNG